MNLSSILAELYRRTDQPSSPSAAVTTRLTSFVNITHRQILATPGFDTLRDDVLTFASVANQVRYGLPPAISRIESITDRTTMLKLQQRMLGDIRASDPGLVQVGASDCYVNHGYQQVAMQPSAPTGLWAQSSAAGDNTQKVYVESLTTGGYPNLPLSGGTALNGQNRIQIGTLTSHIEVTKFYADLVGVGSISLYDASSSGNELARIPIGKTYARYLAIQLYPTPASAITYYVDYVREIADMANATDEPLLPQDFHYLLVEGALIKEWTKANDADRRAMAEKDFAKGMSALKYFVNCPPDLLLSRGDMMAERSRFGAYFPATRG